MPIFYRSLPMIYHSAIRTRINGIHTIKAPVESTIEIIPKLHSNRTKPVKIAVVRTAFVTCLPMMLAKKKVYRAAITGLTVVSARPTINFSAPVSNIKTKIPNNIAGA